MKKGVKFMEQSVIYNNTVFNNLFSPKEFELLNYMNNSLEQIDNIIE